MGDDAYSEEEYSEDDSPSSPSAVVTEKEKENAPPPQHFSADDDDLEALFVKTTAVSSATAQRGPRRVKPKGDASSKPGGRTAPQRGPPPSRVRPPQEIVAADAESPTDSAPIDFKAIEDDEAAIDRELMRLSQELRAISRPKSSQPGRTDSGFVPRERAKRRASSAGRGHTRAPRGAPTRTADAELDDELARLQAQLKQLDRHKSEGSISTVRASRPRTANDINLLESSNMALRVIPGGREARGRKSSGRPSTAGSAFAASVLPRDMLRGGSRLRNRSLSPVVGPAWDATPVGRGPNDTRPVVLVGCDPHADQEIQMRNRLFGAAAKPRRLPSFTDSGLPSAATRSGTPAAHTDAADQQQKVVPTSVEDKKDRGEVEHVEAVTQTTSHDLVTHEGMLTVTIVQAQGLLNADEHGGGSDPYVRIGMGGQEYVTTINRDIEFNHSKTDHLCEWNETFSLRVAQPHDTLEMEIYDYDQGDEDDLLGGVMVPPYNFPPPGEEKETWFRIETPNHMHMRPAKEVTSQRERLAECHQGCLCVVLRYVPRIWMQPSRGVRSKALQMMQSDEQAKMQWPPYGKLHVRIVEAKGLPKLKQLKNTNPFAVVSYGGRFEQTPVIFQSTKPHWDALFSFNVFELRRGMTIEIFDFDKMKKNTAQFDRLGTVSFSVADELDGNKRADSWMMLWDQSPKTEMPIQRGALRVRLEYSPAWKQGGRKSKADAGGGWPQRMQPQAATILLTIPKAVGLLPAVPERRVGRAVDSERDSDSDEEAGAPPTVDSPHNRKPINVESDSYCQVSVFTKSGDLQGTLRTDTVKSTVSPNYNTEMPLAIPISDPQAIVRLDCFHETRRGRPDLHLGGFYLPVAFAMRSGILWHDEREDHWFRLEEEDALTYSIGSKPPTAILVDGELSRQYNCPRGAVLLRKTYGLEKMEEGMDIGLGRLTVTIIRAKKLPDIKRKSDKPPDAFAVLSYDTLTFDTEIIKRSRKPVWGQEFSFPITDIRSSFTVSLFDNGLTGDHELIGSVSVGLNEVLRNSALDQQPWYKIFRTNEYGRLRANGEVQLRLHYKANSRTTLDGAHTIPTVAAPRTIRSTMRTMRQMRRQVAAMQDIRPKAPVAELTDAQKQAKQEQDALVAVEMMKKSSNPNPLPSVSTENRGDSGTLHLQIERARSLPTFTVCYCQASIESADGSLVGSPGKSIQWSSLSDDDDAVFAFTTTLSMTSAEDYLRVEIIGIEASRQAQVCRIFHCKQCLKTRKVEFCHECGCVQLHAAGDTQGAQDAAAVHGDDKDKAPAKRAPLCGFRVLLSTLGNTEGNGSQWYKLAAVRPATLYLVIVATADSLLCCV